MTNIANIALILSTFICCSNFTEAPDCCHISRGESNKEKQTNKPKVRKATSLTNDSKAIASITPGCRSVTSIFRIPKRIVKTTNTMLTAKPICQLARL